MAGNNMRQKFTRCLRFRRFCISGSHEFAPMIIGAADQDLFPRLSMSRRESVPVRELINLLWRQVAKQFDCELAEQGVAQTVESLEVPKKEDQPLKMRGLE